MVFAVGMKPVKETVAKVHTRPGYDFGVEEFSNLRDVIAKLPFTRC